MFQCFVIFVNLIDVHFSVRAQSAESGKTIWFWPRIRIHTTLSFTVCWWYTAGENYLSRGKNCLFFLDLEFFLPKKLLPTISAFS